MSKELRYVYGILLIGAGLVAMPIPILPGIPLVAAGVAMLGSNHPLIRTCRTWLESKGLLKRERKTDELSNV